MDLLHKLNPKEAGEKCKNFITGCKEAILTIYKDEDDDNGRPYPPIPFLANSGSFPKVQVTIPDEIYQVLLKTKRYRIAISKGPDHRAFSMRDVVLTSVPASVDTSGQSMRVFLMLEEMWYVDKSEKINQKVSFET